MRVKLPLLPNLVFVNTTATHIDEIVKTYVRKNRMAGTNKKTNNVGKLSKDTGLNKPAATHYVNYYYDHFRRTVGGYNPPLTIPDQQMRNFITLTSVDSDHILIVNKEICHFKSGDIVRIIDGKFKGINGRVARIAGQQRVVIELSNLCLVATAYIPNAFLEIIDK